MINGKGLIHGYATDSMHVSSRADTPILNHLFHVTVFFCFSKMLFLTRL